MTVVALREEAADYNLQENPMECVRDCVALRMHKEYIDNMHKYIDDASKSC
jgi:hypothetical protein